MKYEVIGLDKVIGKLEAYKKAAESKVNLLAERLAVLGAHIARTEFSNAFYAGDNDVEIKVEATAGGYKIVAEGYAVLFIEFGSGVLNPEHPQAEEFGYNHGEYGQGKGANEKGWVYSGEQGNAGQPLREGVYRTMGNPPAMAMYKASKDMRAEIYRIAEEVFR